MIKSTLLTIIFITASPLILSAQKYFIPGYVIIPAGDTVKGFLNYKATKATAEQCEFRDSKKGTSVIYSASKIIGYGFTGSKQFILKEMPIDSGKTEKVFIEILVRGKISLYRNHQSFFVEKDKIYELKIETNIVSSDKVYDELKKNPTTQNYEQKKKKYIGILDYLFLDCAGLSNEINRVGLNEKDLVKITKKYNQCIGADYRVMKEEGKGTNVDFFLTTGYSNTSLSFETSYYPFISAGYASMKSTSPLLGLGLQVSNPLGSENLSATIEFQYSKEFFHGIDTVVKSTYTYYDDYKIHYTKIKLPIGIKYKFSSGPISPYVRFGISFTFFTNGDINAQQTQVINQNGSAIESNSSGNLSKMHVSQLWGSAGVQIKLGKVKTFLEIRGDAGGGKANNGVYLGEGTNKPIVIDPKSAKSQTLSLVLGVSF